MSVELRLPRFALALAAAVVLAVAAPGGLGPLSPSAAKAVQDVLWYQQCANGVSSMLGSWGDGAYTAGAQCPTANAGNGYSGLWLYSSNGTGGGTVAHWEADAPPNIGIVMAHVPEMAIDNNSYYYGEFFYWAGGNSGWLTNTNGQATSWPSGSGWQSFAPSPYFGWEIACNASSGCYSNTAWFDVFDLQLEALEYQTPNITAGPYSGASNLWYHAGEWIRGVFPIDMEADDPSGVCDMRVWWNGQIVQDTGERTPDGGYWDQCDPNHSPGSPQYFFGGGTINTSDVAPQSATGVQLALQAHNASYNPSTGTPDWTSDVEYLNIDNTPVGLTLGGPTNAPVNAGTQYLTATANAGPSGVGAIDCSVDGAQWLPERVSGVGSRTATALVPLNGVGEHHVSCYATNRAVDSSGIPAASPVQTWSTRIGEPVAVGISFSKVSRHCHRIHKLVTIPARWVTVRRGHKYVRVHRPARKRRKWVNSCTVRGPVTHSARIAHGRKVTVTGWLATADGTPLSHVRVRILTLPDGGSYSWRTARTVTTSADGGWRATLPAGPSRLIKAVYAGGPTTEPAASASARALVPASSTLTLMHRVLYIGAFGVEAQFEGRLVGGFVPPRGATVAVQALDRGLWRTIATVTTDREGRWQAHYKVTGGPGNYVIRVYVPRQGGYPWESSYSGHAALIIRQ